MEKKDFEFLELMAIKTIHPLLFHHMTMEQVMMSSAGELALHLKASVVRAMGDGIVIDVPKNWWQAFKYHFRAKWWMRWIVRRWPVVTMVMTFDVVFPAAAAAAPLEYRWATTMLTTPNLSDLEPEVHVKRPDEMLVPLWLKPEQMELISEYLFQMDAKKYPREYSLDQLAAAARELTP